MNTVNKQIVSQAIPVTILPITVYSVVVFIKRGVPLSSLMNNTTIWWGISFVILGFFFFSKYSFFDKRNERNMRIVWVYLLWNAICIVRGMFVAEIYWDWKALIGNTMALMLPIAAYAATNKVIVQSLLAFYVKYALPLFLLFAVILRTDAYGFYLAPVSFLLLFLPVLSKRQKVILLGLTAVVFVADLGARSNVIKFGVPVLILAVYYARRVVTLKLLETVRLALLIIPIILFVLGVSGTFNIFDTDSYIKGDYTATGTDMQGNKVEENVMADTRTFLYKEVLGSAIENNYWLFGRTPARGNDSDSFGVWAFEVTGRYERIENEIGLANVFTWTGLIGVILYSILFFRASYFALNKSKNIYAKMLGIYVAFRWLYAWVEDVNNFSLNYFMLMIMIGLCFSHSFRNMTEKEVVFWVRGIFDNRYIRFQNNLIKKKKNYER